MNTVCVVCGRDMPTNDGRLIVHGNVMTGVCAGSGREVVTS